MKQEERSTKGRIVGLVVGAIAFALSYYGVQQFFKVDVESELQNAALELNKQTPLNVDQYTRLDSASSSGKTHFTYYYTLLDVQQTEVNIDTVNKYIRPTIIEGVKNSPELKFFRENDVTMDYKYYDKHGTFVTQISVTPDLYKD